jgi:hypothetical protein
MLNLTAKQKENLLDYTISIGFGFFLIFHTGFNNVGIPWFIALCIFNVLMQLYKYTTRLLDKEKVLEEEDD